MCSFVILLLSNEMQMSVRRFSAIPHLRDYYLDKDSIFAEIQTLLFVFL